MKLPWSRVRIKYSEDPRTGRSIRKWSVRESRSPVECYYVADSKEEALAYLMVILQEDEIHQLPKIPCMNPILKGKMAVAARRAKNFGRLIRELDTSQVAG